MRSVLRYLPAAVAYIALLVGSINASVAADSVVYQLGWLPTGDISAAYLGVANGMFAAEGLDVTVKIGRGSLDAVSKVGSGTADISASGLGAVLQFYAESRVPVKVVMSQYTEMPDALLTYKGSGITTIKQVVGRTVATATFSGTTAFWPDFLHSNGVDPASVKLVKADASALAGLLASGQVDGTLNWVTTAPDMAQALKETGKELVVLPWSEMGYQGYGYVLIASDKMIKERPDVLRRFVIAYRRVLQAAVADPNLVGAAVKKQVPEVDENSVSAEFRASVPLIENDISKRQGLGTLDPKLVEATWKLIANAQGYPLDKIDPEQVVDRSFLSAK